MDFVDFNLAKKLEEKGFTCKYPFAMYNEDGQFFPLYSSDRYYFGIDDFDDEDYIAPTISQVLKWLREEKKLHIEIYMYHNCYLWEIYNTNIYEADFTQKSEKYSEIEYENYEQAALAGIEYVLENIIQL